MKPTAANFSQVPLQAEHFAADRPQREGGFFGMVLFVLAESTFFIGVFFAYSYMKSTAEAWPPVGTSLPTQGLAIVNTVVSLLSVVAIWYANRAIAKNNLDGLIRGTIAALILAVLFVAVQGIEFRTLAGLAKESAYGSIFIALLVFHLARVLVGALMMTVVLIRALLGQFNPQRRLLVRATALYWYFIVGIWLLVFYTLYVAPQLQR